VCTLLFATFFAVRTGPASAVATEIAKARMIEKNTFMVLISSLLTGRARLLAPSLFRAALRSEVWARQDSNLGPRDYESPALTAELQARINHAFKHSISLLTNLESEAQQVNFGLPASAGKLIVDCGFGMKR
jgi:hypothetical protein